MISFLFNPIMYESKLNFRHYLIRLAKITFSFEPLISKKTAHHFSFPNSYPDKEVKEKTNLIDKTIDTFL